MPFETYDHVLQCIEETIESKRKSFWVALNPIKIYRAWHEPVLLNLLRQTDVNICDGVGVGGSFDIASGSVKRAPKIFRMTGTEFLFRLASEPRKRLSNWKVLFYFLLRVVGRRLSGADASVEWA